MGRLCVLGSGLEAFSVSDSDRREPAACWGRQGVGRSTCTPAPLQVAGRERHTWECSEAGRLGELPIPGAAAGRRHGEGGSLQAAVDPGPFLGLGSAAGGCADTDPLEQ